jgi:hypothetical protein
MAKIKKQPKPKPMSRVVKDSKPVKKRRKRSVRELGSD